MSKKLILNEQIRATQVRLIGDNGEQLGVMPIAKALELARSKDLELALIALHDEAPVCKLLDYGKYLYQQSKLESKQKSKQKTHEIKGVRLGFNTGEHDMQVKIKAAKQFLSKGHPIKVQLQLRGREMAYKDLALAKANSFADSLVEDADIEARPKLQGYQITMILNPKK